MSCLDTFEISEYVDGALPPTSCAEVEAHLAQCAPCRAIEDDLRRLHALARTLTPLEPPSQVWHRIAVRIESPRRRWALSGLSAWRVLPAAAAVLLAVTSLTWLGGALTPPDARMAGALGIRTDVARVETRSEFLVVEAELTSAIAGLEQVAVGDRQTLDPLVSELLTSNLAVIDSAIDESRTALAADPDSDVIQDTLFDALTHKMALLEDIVALMHEARMDLDGDAGATSEVNP